MRIRSCPACGHVNKNVDHCYDCGYKLRYSYDCGYKLRYTPPSAERCLESRKKKTRSRKLYCWYIILFCGVGAFILQAKETSTEFEQANSSSELTELIQARLPSGDINYRHIDTVFWNSIDIDSGAKPLMVLTIFETTRNGKPVEQWDLAQTETGFFSSKNPQIVYIGISEQTRI